MVQCESLFSQYLRCTRDFVSVSNRFILCFGTSAPISLSQQNVTPTLFSSIQRCKIKIVQSPKLMHFTKMNLKDQCPFDTQLKIYVKSFCPVSPTQNELAFRCDSISTINWGMRVMESESFFVRNHSSMLSYLLDFWSCF